MKKGLLTAALTLALLASALFFTAPEARAYSTADLSEIELHDEIYLGVYDFLWDETGTYYDVPWVVWRAPQTGSTGKERMPSGATGLPLISKYILPARNNYSPFVLLNNTEEGSEGYYNSTFTGTYRTLRGEVEVHLDELFKRQERDALLPVTLVDSSMSSIGDDLTNQKLFPMAENDIVSGINPLDPAYRAATAINPDYLGHFVTQNWWTRTSRDKTQAIYIGIDGGISAARVYNSFGLRPACYLEWTENSGLSNYPSNNPRVRLITTAAGGKPSGPVGPGALTANPAPPAGAGATLWKLTLYDIDRYGFYAAPASGQGDNITAGQPFKFDYREAKSGTNEFISAIIYDYEGSRSIKYYGRVVDCGAAGSESGRNKEIIIPAELSGRYRILLFNEQCNGDYKTDYSSFFKYIQVNIAAAPKSAAPTADVTTVAKTSAAQLAVDFTLTNDPPLAGVWKVYGAASGGSPLADVTASASGATLTLSHLSGVPAGTYYISVTEAGKTESDRLALTVGAVPITSIALSAGAPQVGTPITTTLTPAGATADYQWYTNTTGATTGGSPIQGETGDSYTPTAADGGRYLYVTATGTGSYGGTASAVTTGKVPISLTGVTLSPDAAVVGTAITATPAPAGATASYEWKYGDDSPIAGAPTGSSYTPTNDDYGKTIKVVATGTGSYTGTVSAATTKTVTLSAVITPRSSFIKGRAPANLKLTIGGGITANLGAADFGSLTVDGVAVASGSGTFTVADGSVAISFAQSYLNSLPVGAHSIVVTLTGSYAGNYSASITVSAAPAPSPGRANPNTGA